LLDALKQFGWPDSETARCSEAELTCQKFSQGPRLGDTDSGDWDDLPNPPAFTQKLTRRKRLHNRYFPSLDDVIAAVEAQFNLWASPNDILRKLCVIT
jgi:hypothetical protein